MIEKVESIPTKELLLSDHEIIKGIKSNLFRIAFAIVMQLFVAVWFFAGQAKDVAYIKDFLSRLETFQNQTVVKLQDEISDIRKDYQNHLVQYHGRR